jgi:hypothetical protein
MNLPNVWLFAAMVGRVAARAPGGEHDCGDASQLETTMIGAWDLELLWVLGFGVW